MDRQNCLICQNLLNGQDPGHDFDENGSHFMNLRKILKSTSNFDYTEIESSLVNPHKICLTCHHQLTEYDRLTGQLKELQLMIKELGNVIKNKTVQSQQFRKENFWSSAATYNSEDDKNTFDPGTNGDDNIPFFDFDIDSYEDHRVDEADAKVDIKVANSTLNLPPNFQLKLSGPHVVNGANVDDLDLTSKYSIFDLKKIKISLEPIILPSTRGSYSIKDLEISNFIRRDRDRINKFKRRIREKKYRKRKRATGTGYKRVKKSRKFQASQQCLICQKSFYCKSNLEDHIRIHTGERPFICENCGMAFRSESFLKGHMKRIHSERTRTKTKIKCPVSNCPIYCNSQTRLDQHTLEIHQNGLRKFLCEQCPRGFKELSRLNDHIKCVHQGDFYKCSYPNCESKLTSESAVRIHIQKVHEKVVRFFCPEPECNKGFFKNSEMERHHKVKHLGESSYEFACDYDQCKRRFVIKKSLEVHKLMVHTDASERPLKCSICSKGFARINSLKEHERLHTGIRDFICNYENCSQAYALKSQLNEHHRKHHRYPGKHLSKNVENRKKFRRRVNRVEIIKNLEDIVEAQEK